MRDINGEAAPMGMESGGKNTLPDALAQRAVLFVINMHAATVNMRLYPPTSSMVTETLEQAYARLKELLIEGGRLSVSAVDGKILVDGVKLDELEQQKPPIRSFVGWMNERGLANMDFDSGATLEELRASLEVVGLMGDRPEVRKNLEGEMRERGVRHVSLNQRVFVAVAPGVDASALAAGIGGRATPLDALKDELLIRYLMGKVKLSDVKESELVEVLSDSAKVGGLLSSFIAHEGTEGGVFVRSRKAEDGLNRLAAMAEEVEDEELRTSLTDQVTSVIAQMTPLEMTSLLSAHAPESVDIDLVRRNVVEMLSDEELLQVVDSLVVEYLDLKHAGGALDREWARRKLKNMNDVLMELKAGERGEAISDYVDSRLDEAGISEERDMSTGKRVLSAYQLLGGPLEEGDLPDISEGDSEHTVAGQIKQLFEMGEHDLTEGMLVKLADNLGAGSERVRRYAAHLVKETLGGLDQEQVRTAARVLVPPLKEAVAAEEDYQTFVHEVDSLGRFTETYLKGAMVDEAAGILELLISLSSPGHPGAMERKRHAALVLNSLMGPGGLIDTARILSQEDREKRRLTVLVLSKLGTDALAPLVDIIKDRSQVDVRGRAFEALKVAGSAGIRALAAELKKPNPWYIYRNVLRVMGELADPEAVEDVCMMAGSYDERIRREVIRSLARIGSPAPMEFVMEAIGDPSPSVRRTAVRALGFFGDSRAAPFLMDIIENRDRRPKEESQGLAEAACLALGDLKESSLCDYLAGLVGRGGLLKKGKSPEVRAAACIALGTIGDPASVPVLEKALQDQSLVVRSSAEKALKTLTGGLAGR